MENGVAKSIETQVLGYIQSGQPVSVEIKTVHDLQAAERGYLAASEGVDHTYLERYRLKTTERALEDIQDSFTARAEATILKRIQRLDEPGWGVEVSNPFISLNG